MFSNFQHKLLALILAIFFWVFILSLEANFYPFPQEISIKAFNLSPDLALSQELGQVHLTLKTNQEILTKLQPSDFEVYVDLTDLETGEHHVPILVTSKNSQTSVVKIIPPEISVILEVLIHKTLPLNVKIQGQPAPNYQVGEPESSLGSIQVIGAQSIIEPLVDVKAIFKLDGTETFSLVKKAHYQIPGIPKSLSQHISFDPPETNLYLPITQILQSKNVGIRVKIAPQESSSSYFIQQIEANPNTVVITGKKEDLNSFNYLETETVNLKNLDFTNNLPFQKKISLILPKNVTLLYPGNQLIQVEITFGEIFPETETSSEKTSLNNPDALYSD